MTVKQTATNHLKVLPTTMITTMLYFGAFWYLGFQSDLSIILLIGYILTVVPSFYLHLNYYLNDREKICQILPEKLVIIKNGVETVLEAACIKDVVIYKSASIESGGIPITPMESYFYVRIIDQSDNEYTLSCLLDPKIDQTIRAIKGVKFWTERGIFNLIK
jgi:hypothetical protein